ncbi:MAG: acetyl-CoA carboxylase biotin carboxyl carrier protein subunit [Bacteroidales bacterium]|nr:acetyl-CoA carboxylase biotin carboxyl carrier protein subunit [Lentimicrobiaceae bacterium]MDD5694187.1 acetyl-CoA carboxylase biotin carboxyl carrier protein subunit [Bacteroidales bacterium]
MNKLNHSENNFKSLTIDNIKYRTQLTSKFLARKKFVPSDPKKILSFIPGSIRKVNVQSGSEVKANDILMILEAMKMNNYILSPGEGIVKKVNVKPGDTVPKDFILLEFK